MAWFAHNHHRYGMGLAQRGVTLKRGNVPARMQAPRGNYCYARRYFRITNTRIIAKNKNVDELSDFVLQPVDGSESSLRLGGCGAWLMESVSAGTALFSLTTGASGSARTSPHQIPMTCHRRRHGISQPIHVQGRAVANRGDFFRSSSQYGFVNETFEFLR